MDKHFGFFFFFIFSSPLDIFDAQLNKCAKRAGHGIPSTASLPWSALPYPLVAGSIHYATARAPLLPSPSSVNSESDPATLTFWLLLTYWLARLRICPPPHPPLIPRRWAIRKNGEFLGPNQPRGVIPAQSLFDSWGGHLSSTGRDEQQIDHLPSCSSLTGINSCYTGCFTLFG